MHPAEPLTDEQMDPHFFLGTLPPLQAILIEVLAMGRQLSRNRRRMAQADKFLLASLPALQAAVIEASDWLERQRRRTRGSNRSTIRSRATFVATRPREFDIADYRWKCVEGDRWKVEHCAEMFTVLLQAEESSGRGSMAKKLARVGEWPVGVVRERAT